jgi:hypothetical protein
VIMILVHVVDARQKKLFRQTGFRCIPAVNVVKNTAAIAPMAEVQNARNAARLITLNTTRSIHEIEHCNQRQVAMVKIA